MLSRGINNTGKTIQYMSTLNKHGEVLTSVYWTILFGILKLKIYTKREN